LRDLTAQAAPTLIALFTIRSDNYERLQTAKALEGVRQHTLSLAPMAHGAYADVIKGPAQQLKGNRALTIEEPLVDALLADIEAGGAKDALPLLAFTLERLYREQGGDGDLTLADYEDLGRIKGSIEAAVERALSTADGNAKIPQDRQARLALLRRGLIPWLAGIDTETGSPRRRVARLSEIPEEARPLIDLLVEQRLLATDVAKDSGEVTVEPAHEALLRQWGLLRGWLVEDTALLSVLEGVKRSSRDWAANHRSAAWLTHTTHRLADAERLRERPDLSSNLEPTDRDYLTACRDSELAGHRQTRRIQAAFGFLILLLASTGVAWWKKDILREYYHWHYEMEASVLAADKEKELASRPKAAFVECKHGCPVMVVVPAGKFLMGTAGAPGMGCDPSDPCEGPQHEVRIARNLAVSKTEVTLAQWDACAEAGACQGKKLRGCETPHACDDRPVTFVSWEESVGYTKWLSRLTGRDYRLLSEAEWEYAARAGSPANYSFGDKASELDQYAWFSDNAHKETHPVGEKKANAFGLQDIHGNAMEWVEDNFHESYEDAPTDGMAWREGGDELRRMVRGGSWSGKPDKLRSASRTGGISQNVYDTVGFRVARTLNP
jgi:formylglycine-generating enzyme required for sulfatase activity